ncbi:deaminase domain-containing protein [Neobacillus sp. YX16]|uniref:deaminase domain-containing protein n=1 Tax=Neobacillus sp. YX16 TaxID=3047874 RepID=UPI0024C347DE|nr:deaminase domain-containing protein [Neobacillus sp. YX16]WHZ03415.1 deaminase domain-containing protein [Neobacillus sp. YX16]
MIGIFYAKDELGRYFRNVKHDIEVMIDTLAVNGKLDNSIKLKFDFGNFGVASYDIPGIGKNTIIAHSKIGNDFFKSHLEVLPHEFAAKKWVPGMSMASYVSSSNIEYKENSQVKRSKKLPEAITITEGEGQEKKRINYSLRNVDTEYKIIAYIYEKIQNKIKEVQGYTPTGKINIYTELAVCPSCERIIKEFSAKYSKIEVNVFYRQVPTKGGK